MYTVGQSISRCPLLVSGAAQLFRFPLLAVQLAFRCVLWHRSPGNGQAVYQQESSNGRHHNNKSSFCHLQDVFKGDDRWQLLADVILHSGGHLQLLVYAVHAFDSPGDIFVITIRKITNCNK